MVYYTTLPFWLRHVKNNTTNDNNKIEMDLILAHLGWCAPMMTLGKENVAIMLERIKHTLGNAHEVAIDDC